MIRKKISKLNIIWHKVKSSVPRMGSLLFRNGQEVPIKTSKHYTLLSRLLVSLQNLVVRTHCRSQHFLLLFLPCLSFLYLIWFSICVLWIFVWFYFIIFLDRDKEHQVGIKVRLWENSGKSSQNMISKWVLKFIWKMF